MSKARGGASPDGITVLGRGKRVLICKLTDEDKREIDRKSHALQDRELAVAAERERVNKALGQREKQLEKERLELHRVWNAGEEERVVEIEVVRDDRRGPGEIVTRRLDTGVELSRRPLSQREQLDMFDHGEGTDNVEELDTEDAVKDFTRKAAEHESQVEKLLEMVDLSTLLEEATASEAKKATPSRAPESKAANDAGAEDTDAEDDEPPKQPARRARKGSGRAKKTAAKRAAPKRTAAVSGRRPAIGGESTDEEQDEQGGDDE